MLVPLIAANWKMHRAPAEFDARHSPYRGVEGADVIVFPSILDLELCVQKELLTGAQYGHPEDAGAHTGDISMAMLQTLGATYVLCGHSERRRDHGETDAFVREQVVSALKHGMHPLLCVGETEEERAAGKEKETVARQLAGMPSGITVAYEPVWAIGTGNTATPAQAEAMHAFIRSHLVDGAEAHILYGGSVTAENASALFAEPDIDGALVGGASLKPAEFRKIVEAAVGKS